VKKTVDRNHRFDRSAHLCAGWRHNQNLFVRRYAAALPESKDRIAHSRLFGSVGRNGGIEAAAKHHEQRIEREAEIEEEDLSRLIERALKGRERQRGRSFKGPVPAG